MAKKVFSKDMLTPGSATLDKLREAVQKSVVLDEHWNVIEFAQQMMGFTGGNLQFKTIPVGSIGLQTPGDGDAVEVNPREVKTFVQGLLHGEGQPASSAPSSTGGAEKITVDVRNASGRTGLAGKVSQTLTAQGFQAGETGNATTRTASVVRFAGGEQASGDRVAATLGGIPAEADPNVPKGHVTVLLGKDFQTPTGNQTTSRPAPVQSASSAQPATPTADGCVN
jgi:hypothetical protein